MKIILADINPELVASWRQSFALYEDIEVVSGDITQVKCDAVVSPANSFGFMDGGVDYALSVRFGWDLEKKLQQMIRELPEGELLVGQTLTIETNDAEIPLLISAPTMRIPTNFNINTSVNAYLAMKAILIKAVKDERISSIAVPGLCTGVGGMSPETSSSQMLQAYKEIILGERMNFSTFGEAQKYHWNLNKDGMIWTH